ncbi:MAG TPA: RDD family protein [Chitinophagaceae bacterium]
MTSIDNKPISVGTRLGAMFLDHFFMTIIAMIFVLPGLISNFSDASRISHEQEDFIRVDSSIKYMLAIGLALYFCKDIINGRSIAKRILRLQVVDNATGRVATPRQSFVRNIFCILWPIEVIIAITNTSRRFGDRVAGTKLVHYGRALEQPSINIGKTLLPLIISYSLLVLLMHLSPSPSVSMQKTNYSETSYNQAESKELERLIIDSLGEYMAPDIRIYDTVKNENLKYVSTILKLKRNFISENFKYNWIHEKTTTLIYSRLPKETFTGQIKYVYQGNGQFQKRTTTIGTYIQLKDKK